MEAVRRYLESREESILPRFVSPPTFVCLWLLLGLLIGAGVVTWFAQVPVYVPGLAVVVGHPSNVQSIHDDVMVVVFLPPQYRSQLQAGQKLFLSLDRAGKRLERMITAVEPEISSPDLVQRRFGLSAGAAEAITRPSAIAFARLEPMPASLPAATYAGSVYRAEVEVGSRRAISLLPLIGQLFEG
jgi:hypothetical protein